LAISCAAVLLGLVLRISLDEWLWIIVAIGAVWYSEAVNTAIERLADAVTLEHHPKIKLAKDCAAASVLIVGLGALLVALIIFVPRIGQLWSR
jgi:diacylglycerol kinase